MDTISNFARVANPFSSQAVTAHANSINVSVSDFAAHAELELAGLRELGEVKWGHAAKALFGQAAAQVGATGAEVAGKAKVLSSQMQERQEDALLAMAEKVKRKRAAKSESITELGSGTAD